MAEYKVAVIPGDGVGLEVIDEGRKALEAVAGVTDGLSFQFTEFPWGSEFYRETGKLMPDDGIETLKGFDTILFGAVGDPNIPDHITLHGLLLPMRRSFDQGVCIRPAYLYPGVESPLSGKKAGDIDMVIFRENTEGEYAPVGGRLYAGTAHETVVQTNMFTRRGTERIIRAAFEYCVRRNKGNKVTSVTKSNAQSFGMVFWDEVFADVAADFPQIETESLLVDRAAMDFVRWPEDFDVVVASNLFADILSDIAAVVTGSMGLAPSANINPEREYPSLFEPVHGAAFDIMGKGIANPLATVSAVAMMLDHLGEQEAAERVDRAVARCLEQRTVLTADLGGTATTAEMGYEAARLIREG
ncbi:MAG: tartrate dehydrogenase [SAR202 cluster bacterium]|jgi:tartrate dehydrogenase/decarboxylase/D-malate dehydrogenase|nr:tartrate dehydrogenase [Chloroflexota bacterium]MQG48777.1 tartrate dehydrogenase [SAR202 cluster bacterium]MQG79204.1 tartrate dehydrogenase [SAR202 cluster bacterium]|tara:strand:+ start:561 stop:1634 length:1074 start_codon:yes stop_codon:yes gene_type:complete